MSKLLSIFTIFIFVTENASAYVIKHGTGRDDEWQFALMGMGLGVIIFGIAFLLLILDQEKAGEKLMQWSVPPFVAGLLYGASLFIGWILSNM